MTGAIWSARWYLDGVPVGSLTTDGATATTNDDVQISIAGVSSTNDFRTWYGQVITYDDWNDDGSKPLYVTRIQPTDDLGGAQNVGTWTPVGAPNNWEAVESPFNTSSFLNEPSTSTGDKIMVASGLGSNIATQAGIGTGSPIYGVTNHAWVTGSGLSGTVGIGKNDGVWNYTTGQSIFPDTNDPTYGFVTSGSFIATDAPTMVYEVE